jgi:hypothetical protein
LACSRWGLLAEWVIWLLAKGGLFLSGRLAVAAILRILAALGTLLRHGLRARQWCR